MQGFVPSGGGGGALQVASQTVLFVNEPTPDDAISHVLLLAVHWYVVRGVGGGGSPHRRNVRTFAFSSRRGVLLPGSTPG